MQGSAVAGLLDGLRMGGQMDGFMVCWGRRKQPRSGEITDEEKGVLGDVVLWFGGETGCCGLAVCGLAVRRLTVWAFSGPWSAEIAASGLTAQGG